mmetsp:Transcript_103256/g.267301  ORF Transcript_103256/g.267301 Transcript_103256/m.267301 type:complete len:228 (-) Transcript_103256:408-1091(-)
MLNGPLRERHRLLRKAVAEHQPRAHEAKLRLEKLPAVSGTPCAHQPLPLLLLLPLAFMRCRFSRRSNSSFCAAMNLRSFSCWLSTSSLRCLSRSSRCCFSCSSRWRFLRLMSSRWKSEIAAPFCCGGCKIWRSSCSMSSCSRRRSSSCSRCFLNLSCRSLSHCASTRRRSCCCNSCCRAYTFTSRGCSNRPFFCSFNSCFFSSSCFCHFFCRTSSRWRCSTACCSCC